MNYTEWINSTDQELVETYLDEFVFYDLHDLNTGFDADCIRYHSEAEFEIVLQRVQEQGLGIFGIEPWKNGQYYDVIAYKELCNDPIEPAWYWLAFEEFKSRGVELQYSATYYVPEHLLKKVT